MGRAVAAACAQDSGLTIAARIEQGDPIAPAIEGCEVMIDFSAADATAEVCAACASKKPAVEDPLIPGAIPVSDVGFLNPDGETSSGGNGPNFAACAETVAQAERLGQAP